MKKLKNSSFIIGELMSLTHYKPLRYMIFCKDFLASMMSKQEQELIENIYIYKDVFYIITKHPAAYQNLNHDSSKKNIKFRINLYAKTYPESNFALIKNIKIYSKNYRVEKKIPLKKQIETQSKYIELAKPNFINHFANPNLFASFEELRELIKNA